ncbi:MAG: hypothetical protein HUJ25_03910 [Crocinitomicaceae bacterium]|nr:hypothetical protein [Crocinitomicaceae bacterium]
MKICMLTLFLVLGSVSALSQSDTLNRTNSDGEKTGWWIIYLDDNLKQLKDSVGATHCRYAYYSGLDYEYNKGIIKSDESSIQFPASDTLMLGSLKLLNGDYVAYHDKGNVKFVLTAQNGFLTEYIEYHTDGRVKTHFVYFMHDGVPVRGDVRIFDKDE